MYEYHGKVETIPNDSLNPQAKKPHHQKRIKMEEYVDWHCIAIDHPSNLANP